MQNAKLTPRQLARAKREMKYWGNPCSIHGRTPRYVLSGHCVKCHKGDAKADYEREYRNYPSVYYAGKNARSKGSDKIAPSQLNGVDRAWWLAGWHDKDIEAGNRFIESHIRGGQV